MSDKNEGDPLERLRRASDWQGKINARIKREFVDAEALSEEDLRSRIRGKELDEEQFRFALAVFSQQNLDTSASMFGFLVEIHQAIEDLELLGWWERLKYKKMLGSLRRMHDLLEVAWYSIALAIVSNKGRES